MPEKNLPFVSVIVPFYNIEECVEYCLDSLVSQDYEGEYEILCVDDGSTDGTAAALEAYAARHRKVRVLHKSNGGQSDARNYGVEHALGEYVSFVDGDDVVSPYYLSALTGGLQYGDSVLVAGRFKKINFKDIASVSWEQPKESKALNKNEYVQGMCFLAIPDAIWGRLAKRALFLEHPNPVGRIYEDTYVAIEHVEAVGITVLIDIPIYGYVARGGSTIHPKAQTLDKCLQYDEAINRFCEGALRYYGADSDEIVAFKSLGYSRLWRRFDLVSDFPDRAREEQREIRSYVLDHLRQLLSCPRVGKGDKIRFFLLGACPCAYRIAFKSYEALFKGFSCISLFGAANILVRRA